MATTAGGLIFRRHRNIRVIEDYESWASGYSRISGDEGLSVSGFALLVRRQCRLGPQPARSREGPVLYSVSSWTRGNFGTFALIARWIPIPRYCDLE
jgi:hypothetical protein